jgi:hypothetical protein
VQTLPTSSRQLLYMALVLFAPLLLAAALIGWGPVKPGHTPTGTLVAACVVGAVALLFAAIVAACALRHAIGITPGALVVKHGMYTLKIDRAAVTSATVREIASVHDAGLSTRKNGAALLGYYSGWFWGRRGELVFCAVSTAPVHIVTFEGSAKCRQLVLSASPDVARAIAAWAAG